jgi:osmotically-inducible protein OsmY
MFLTLRKVRNDWRPLLIVLAVCGLVACAPTPRSPEQKAWDDAITQRVEAALAATPNRNFSRVWVQTFHGGVYLGGLVWTNDEIVTAVHVARSTPGVVRVTNRLELVSSQTSTRRRS